MNHEILPKSIDWLRRAQNVSAHHEDMNKMQNMQNMQNMHQSRPLVPKRSHFISSGDFSGIRINIWNSAKVRRFITHCLAGGGTHNRGYHAMRSEMVLHGNAEEMGKYAVLSVLPDKIARFLCEYHDTSYTSLGLPPIPLDRSGDIVVSVFTAPSDQNRCNCGTDQAVLRLVEYDRSLIFGDCYHTPHLLIRSF